MDTTAAAPVADSGGTPDTGTTADTNTTSVDASSGSAPVSATETHPSPQEKATAEAKKYKYKLKINGQDEEVEYDEPTLVKELQKSRAASKIREEAARLRQEAQQEAAKVEQERQQFKQIVEALKNPQTARQLLRQIGTPMEALAQTELEDFIKQQQMTPEQRELHELRNWRKQQEETFQRQQQEQQQREYEAQVQAFQEQFSSRIVGAMTKLGLTEADARASGEVAQKLAFKLQQAIDAGYDMTPDELAEELREDIRESHRVLYGKLPPNELFSLFGEEGLKKAQEYATSRVPQVPSVDNPPKSAAAPTSEVPKFRTRQEWLDYVDSIQLPPDEE